MIGSASLASDIDIPLFVALSMVSHVNASGRHRRPRERRRPVVPATRTGSPAPRSSRRRVDRGAGDPVRVAGTTGRRRSRGLRCLPLALTCETIDRATNKGISMSEASEAEPIKVGFLLDYLSGGTDDWSNYAEPMELVFRDGHASNMIDRPVEVALPRGTGSSEGQRQGGDQCVRRARRRGLRGGDRPPHQRQRRRRASARSSDGSRCLRSASAVRRTGWVSGRSC